VVINFSVEQQRFGGDAANVEACAAQLVFFFNQAGLQSELAGAESGRISAGPSADDGDVINSVWQNSAPSDWKIVSRQTSDCKAAVSSQQSAAAVVLLLFRTALDSGEGAWDSPRNHGMKTKEMK
jgi:hypothetical protein